MLSRGGVTALDAATGLPRWPRAAPGSGPVSALTIDARGNVWAVGPHNALVAVGVDGAPALQCAGPYGAWGSAGAVVIAAQGVAVVSDNKGSWFAIGGSVLS